MTRVAHSLGDVRDPAHCQRFTPRTALWRSAITLARSYREGYELEEQVGGLGLG